METSTPCPASPALAPGIVPGGDARAIAVAAVLTGLVRRSIPLLAMLPHVFEMFSQVAPAIERSEGGLGIGLAVVRELVKAHALPIAEIWDLARDPLSTYRCQTGILVDVHPVLQESLKLRQPQSSRFGPDGQPIESSQLGMGATELSPSSCVRQVQQKGDVDEVGARVARSPRNRAAPAAPAAVRRPI